MLIEGKHTCKYCNREFEWYHIPAIIYGSGNKMFEKRPDNKVGFCNLTRSKKENGYVIPIEATAYCPYCNRLNTIDIKSND